MRTVPFSVLDELFYHFDSTSTPPSVHFEIAIPGKIDLERLQAALSAVVDRHLLLRANKMPKGSGITRLTWQILEGKVAVPVTVHQCGSMEEVKVVRDQALSVASRLKEELPFFVHLAQLSDRSHLIFNAHHCVADGLSMYRLAMDTAFYYQHPDRHPEIGEQVPERGDLAQLARPGSLTNGLKRLQSSVEIVRNTITEPPVRVASPHKSKETGYSFETLRFSEEEVKIIRSLAQKPATINDWLIASLLQTIKDWNSQFDVPTGRLSCMMPMNIRPSEWGINVIGNYATYLPISVPEKDQKEKSGMLKNVQEQTGDYKKYRVSGALVDSLSLVPSPARRVLPGMNKLFRGRAIETTLLSNLGRLQFEDGFDASAIDEVWFSPPCFKPMSLAIGVAGMNKELFVVLRFSNSSFDANDRKELTTSLRQEILQA